MEQRPSPVGAAVHAYSGVTALDATEKFANWAHRHWMDRLPTKIRAGEHLAAIILMTFLGRQIPTGADHSGGVDLEFAPIREACLGIPANRPMKFEVKSIPGRAEERPSSDIGDVRHWEHRLDAAIASGDELTDDVRSLSGTIGSLAGLIDRAGDVVEAATAALKKKTASTDSRNIVILSHFFNSPTVEHFDDKALVVGPYLSEPELADDIDTLWLYAEPWFLAVWSNADRKWTTLFLSSVEPGADGMDTAGAMRESEQLFLKMMKYTGSSPWLYEVNSG